MCAGQSPLRPARRPCPQLSIICPARPDSGLSALGLAPAPQIRYFADVPASARTRRLKVCLLSSHPLVLSDLERLLGRGGFDSRARLLQGPARPGAELRQTELPASSVYVLDASSAPGVTETFAASLRERFPASRVIVVAEQINEATAFPLLRAGVKGLLSYSELSRQLPEAAKTVAAGGYWVSRTLLARFVESIIASGSKPAPPTGPPELSRREREVLEALLENLSNKEIAARLYISERTAKFHVANLLAKFGVRRRGDLILQWWQSGPPVR